MLMSVLRACGSRRLNANSTVSISFRSLPSTGRSTRLFSAGATSAAMGSSPITSLSSAAVASLLPSDINRRKFNPRTTKFQLTIDPSSSSLDFDNHPLKEQLTQLGYASDTAKIVKQVDRLLELAGTSSSENDIMKKEDVLMYELIFRALARVDLWEKALSIFDIYIQVPTLACYRAILRVLAGDVLEGVENIKITKKQIERSKEALKLFNQMLYIKVEPDSECVAYVMTTQRKSGNVDEVERIFSWLQQTKQSISQKCYNAMILSCGSRLLRAQQIFAACESQSKMNAITYYGLILSCGSDWKTAVVTLQALLEAPYFVTPMLPRCFDATLKACELARCVEATEAAFTLVAQWQLRNAEATVPESDPLSSVSIGYLLDMCGESPAFVLDGKSNPHMARYWLEEAEGRKLEPLASWYHSAIKSCTKGLEMDPVDEMALEFFQISVERGFRPTLAMYEQLISLLHDWTKIGDLLREVIESDSGLSPNMHFIGVVLEKMMAYNQMRKAQKLYLLSLSREFVPSHWMSFNPPVMDLFSGNFAMSLCALKAGMAEMHELYVVVQSSAKKQSVRPRRVKHPLLLVCRLENIADIQKKLVEDMSITTTVLTQTPRDAGFQLPPECAILQINVLELTFWHTRGALGL